MSIIELRKKSYEELNQKLNELLKDQFKYRMSMSSGELKKNHLIKKVRREIARVNTLIVELKKRKVASNEHQ